MNDQLKTNIEEAANKYLRKIGPVGLGMDDAVKGDFKVGAEWLYNQGYRFTKEDMRAAWKAGMSHEFGDRSFEEWLEERRKGQ